LIHEKALADIEELEQRKGRERGTRLLTKIYSNSVSLFTYYEDFIDQVADERLELKIELSYNEKARFKINIKSQENTFFLNMCKKEL
jgi:hypothetical protein